MSTQVEATRSVAIEGDMTIYQVADVHANLSAHLEGCSDLEIDLSQIGEIDSSGLQLLIAAKRASAARKVNLRFVRHSPAVTKAFEFLNLTGYFNDPLLLPSGRETDAQPGASTEARQ